jgi:hypothetical protein
MRGRAQAAGAVPGRAEAGKGHRAARGGGWQGGWGAHPDADGRGVGHLHLHPRHLAAHPLRRARSHRLAARGRLQAGEGARGLKGLITAVEGRAEEEWWAPLRRTWPRAGQPAALPQAHAPAEGNALC